MATSTTVMDGLLCCKVMLLIHLPQTDYLSQLFHDSNSLLKDWFSNYTFESLILLTMPEGNFKAALRIYDFVTAAEWSGGSFCYKCSSRSNSGHRY